jgi:hypothetical protein
MDAEALIKLDWWIIAAHLQPQIVPVYDRAGSLTLHNPKVRRVAPRLPDSRDLMTGWT